MKGGEGDAGTPRGLGLRFRFGIRHPAFDSSSGFTLLELIVVMLVLSVLFAMAAPAMSGFGAGRAAKQTASQVVALSRWAREQAVSEGRDYRLNFDTANQVYFVTAANGAVFERVAVEFGRNFSVPEGVDVAFDAQQVAAMPYLEFLPSGRSQPAHVRVTSRDGAVTDLACLSATEPLRVVTADELREVAAQ